MKELIEELLTKKSYSLELFNYIDDIEFEEKLTTYIESYLNKLSSKDFFDLDEKNIILFMLTFVALKYYDGGFWPHVSEIFQSLNIDSKTLESKLRNNILSYYSSNFKLGNRYSQIPVMNSLVPYNYLQDYFIFVHDIYTKNFDCNLSYYNVEEELTNIFTSIGNALSDDDDSFKYDYGNQTSKTYKLIRATKNIIKTGIKRNDLIILTKEILRKMDSYYNGRSRKTFKAIDKAFNVWKKLNNISRASHKKNNGFIKSKFPFYTYNKPHQEVYLNTPIKRLYGEYDVNQFEILIYSDENLLYRDNNLKFNQLLGGIEIEKKSYLILNPFSKVKCIIKYKDIEVYNSQDYLYRDYLLFNEEDKEIKNNRNYNGLVYFLYKYSIKGECHHILTKQEYKVCYSYVDESKEYILDNMHIVIFSETRSSAIIGEENKDMYIDDSGKIIPMYNKISEICLVTKNTSLHNYKLLINGKFIENSYYEVIEQNDSIAVIIPFDETTENGVYDVSLYDIKKNKVAESFKFLYDNELQTYQSLVENYEILFSYNGSFMLNDLKGNIYSYLYLLLQDVNHKNHCYININGNQYKIKFKLNVNHYILDDIIFAFSDSINIENINSESKLYFDIRECDKVNLIIDDLIIQMPIKKSTINKYIEINTLLNYKNSYKTAKIIFMKDNEEIENIKVYFDTVYDEISNYEVNSFKNKIYFNTYLHGVKSNETVMLQIQHKDKVVYEKPIDYINNKNTVYLDEKIKKLHYKIYRKIYKFEKFKKIEIEDILYEDYINYYPFADLLNKYLFISDIILFGEEDEELNRKPYNLYLKLIKKISKQSFMGYLYKKTNDTFMGFRKIDELRIDVTNVYKENKYYYFDASIYLYYNDEDDDEPYIDYLQYDEVNKTVFDGTYNKKLYYIDNYKINLTLGEKYGQKKSNIQGEVYKR